MTASAAGPIKLGCQSLCPECLPTTSAPAQLLSQLRAEHALNKNTPAHLDLSLLAQLLQPGSVDLCGLQQRLSQGTLPRESRRRSLRECQAGPLQARQPLSFYLMPV